MKEDSKRVKNPIKTPQREEGACAGGVAENKRVFRRLKSVKDGRVRVKERIEASPTPFDPTAWYVYLVKRNKEIATRDFFAEGKTDFKVEAYVATQVVKLRKGKDGKWIQPERVVIHGKIFVRVAEAHRVAVMQQCPYIEKCLTNPKSILDKDTKRTSYARVPDWQIQQVRQILDVADGIVEFTEEVPEIHENVSVVGGQLLKGLKLGDVKGEVVLVNGHKRATIVLEGMGCFKWSVPLSDIAKV